VEDEGIQCDRCGTWAHGTTNGGCCGLPPSVFEFFVNSSVDAIKWHCPSCEKAPVDPKDKIDTLMAIVLTLQQQNSIILGMLQSQKEARIEKKVEEVLHDHRDREERGNNIVIFNVEESQGADQEAQKRSDCNEIKHILDTVIPGLATDKVEKVMRLGKKPDSKNNSKPRPIKVVLKDQETRNSVLRKAWRLKDHNSLKKVGIAADKTVKERNEEKACREEYRTRKAQEDVVIFKGKVVTKEEREVCRKRERGVVENSGGALGGQKEQGDKKKVESEVAGEGRDEQA
jgi:hypothetical protein